MPRTSRELIDREVALVEVAAVYAELEQRPVERRCELRTECCQFKLTGKTPYLTAGEALVVADALRAKGQTKIRDREDGSCPLLDPRTGRCEVYQERPFSCRTHFCAAAGGPYARKEVVDLIRRLEDVDFALGGAGAQTLPAALRGALAAPVSGGRVRSKPMPRARGRG
jgi:Fe-S-cluster containining protein